MENITNKVLKIAENNSPLKLLQGSYAVIGIAVVVISGLFSLFSQSLGFSLLIVPLVTFTALGLNVVAWALISLAISTAEKSKKRKSPKTTKSAKTSRRK